VNDVPTDPNEPRIYHRRSDREDYDPRQDREWRGPVDPRQFRVPPSDEELKFGAFGGTVAYKGQHVRDFAIVVILAIAIAWIVWASSTDHKAIEHAQVQLTTQTSIQNWLLSLEQDKRPKLRMPVEAWGLLDETGRQKIREEDQRGR
jgi:hypothetical protein